MNAVVALLAFVAVNLLAITFLGVKIVAQLDDLNAALQTDSGDLSTLATDATSIVTLLQQIEQEKNVDLSAPIAAAQALGTGLTTIDAQVQAAIQAGQGQAAPAGEIPGGPIRT